MLADLCLDLWNIFGSALVYSVSIVGGAAAIALVIEHYNGGPRWERRDSLSEADTQEMETVE